MLINATYTAIAPGLSSEFAGSAGASPYTYEILTAGAGGSINATTGIYTAPATYSVHPDIIQCTDSNGAQATLPIMVGTPLMLFCDIIKEGMELDAKQVYLYNQKINIPTDSDVYVAVGVLSCKPFSNTIEYLDDQSIQTTNFMASLSIDILSRSIDALNRKEELIMALNSQYARQQQEKNSFGIAKISSTFNNLSEIEGAAIPYRFNLSVNIQYYVKKVKDIDYFDNFSEGITELINN